jgi:hypothetical protein
MSKSDVTPEVLDNDADAKPDSQFKSLSVIINYYYNSMEFTHASSQSETSADSANITLYVRHSIVLRK